MSEYVKIHDSKEPITSICHFTCEFLTRKAESARQMRIETSSRGGFTDANWNAHRRQCTSECERSYPHQMRITGIVCEQAYRLLRTLSDVTVVASI